MAKPRPNCALYPLVRALIRINSQPTKAHSGWSEASGIDGTIHRQVRPRIQSLQPRKATSN
ncbi:unnamed protein product, partial [Nesidiocoris tenuis]